MNSSEHITTDLLRPKVCARLLGISIQTLWRWHKNEQDFPKCFKLSARISVFYRHEINQYIASKKRLDFR